MEDNIKKAICRNEASRPPMPTDINARLMQRVEKEVNAKPQANRRRIVWPWIAAACVAAMIAVYIAPPQAPQSPKGESLIAHADGDSAVPAKPVSAVKPEMPEMPETPETPEYPDNPKTPAKPKLPATPANTAPPALPSTPTQTDLAMADIAATPAATSTATSAASATASPASSTVNPSASAASSLASTAANPAAATSSASPTAQPRILSERDIPITRPENLKYTKEELALMKRQANEAYIKWIQLELEIAKYNQEQMAQK